MQQMDAELDDGNNRFDDTADQLVPYLDLVRFLFFLLGDGWHGHRD